MVQELVKENRAARAPVSPALLAGALLAAAAALGGVALIDVALPAPLPRDAPPERFSAARAREHLVNLTAIGPRVAGSYENEVVAVGALVGALRRLARAASPHNRVELDLHRASGAFDLSFFDGMNNVYRDVQSVVARVSGAGGRPSRTQLLLNCHFDTVPDSPGASDDGAGCAVLLETLRALAAARRPLRHDAVFLLNGAEENIMQASHAFITQHKWAKSVRAFINIEACGAGGREVLFQAGPHDPWIVEVRLADTASVYAGAVPHPFASSLAQELFESGLVPADTDFRIFRDFGRLSGVDLAWSANGYVYHTRLDTADRVPPAALQRTGDNVLALAHGLLASENLESEVDYASRQPVFFDVLGLFVVSARAPVALLAAAGTLALVALKVHCTARDARAQLFVSGGAWCACVRRAALRACAAAAAGALAACGVALGLHAAGARLSFYSRGWLLAPLYALPALAAAASLLAAWPPPLPLPLRRGWWAARLCGDALCACWAALLLLCALLRLRSGFVPLLWALLPAAADLIAHAFSLDGGARVAAWCAGCALPALQTWYLALGSLAMFVPIMGRAGAPPLPPDVVMAALVAALVQAACSWALPLVAAARGVHRLTAIMMAACLATCALVALTPLGAPYSAERPQRFMVFHVQRHVHAAGAAAVDHLYWLPELDANTPHSVDAFVPGMREARATTAEECARWVYCGAPYYLPVLGLVPRGHWLRAPPHDARVQARLGLRVRRRRLAPRLHELRLNITGPSHVVLVAAPVAGARVAWSSAGGAPRAGEGAPRAGEGAPRAGEGAPRDGEGAPRVREAAPWGARRTYFFALHTARSPRTRPWDLTLHIELPESVPDSDSDSSPIVQLSVAGHDMSGPRAAAHEELLRAFPPTAAPTGWPVHLHLQDV